MQAEAGGDPGRDQMEEIAGLDQQQHGGKRCRDPAEKGALARLTVEIGARVAHHHPADEGDEHQHGGAHRIEP